MNELIRWLKSEGIDVYLVDMDKEGMCLINQNTILISSKLDEYEQIKVTRHELKHFDHKDFFELYKQFTFRSKFENEADVFMIDSFIQENERQFNYTMLMEEFSIGIGYDTKYQNFAN
ncbi:hypothetical protein ABQD64_05460 [Vagococcus fluvialis]|uniref:hypothetical protein n=1 Tax=Vagococcus fluvialis TaxID=2738 RepID=UPI0032E4E66D